MSTDNPYPFAGAGLFSKMLMRITSDAKLIVKLAFQPEMVKYFKAHRR
jgi:hypothetical protein